ncbi:phosphoenolpyruvate carboxylase [bacterium]|nr:phosphoenolpyruvate carboxylase [bacterium]
MVKKIDYKIRNIELSKNISLLGNILGKVVKEQEGVKLYNKIEQIRFLSKASRGAKNKKKIKLNETKKFRQLISSINKLSSKESLIIARSFSKFLNFSNLAESLDNVHKIDERKNQKKQESDSFIILEDAIEKLLKKKSISKEEFYKCAKSLKVDLVLTAHPTEVKRRTLIQKYTEVNNLLEKFNKSRIFKIKNIIKEKNILERNLHEEITSIWKTDELKRSKPTPVEETKWGLAVIEDSLWNTVPKIISRYDKAILDYTGKKLPIDYSPFIFGSWMGGDRDGNPNVTAKITQEVIFLSRWEAANLYEKEFTKIIQKLSMHESSNIIKKKSGKSQEPYRAYLRPIRDKLKITQKEIQLFLNEKKPINNALIVQSINEIINPLTTVYKSLCEVKCEAIANGSILDLLRRAHTFGLNLVKLDIRQEASRHKKLMTSICKHIGLGDFNNWSEDKKNNFLSNEFNSKRPLISNAMKFDKEDRETWATFKMISKLPKECMGAYVISMASRVSDILTVLVLQKKSGIKSCLRTVPLFETLLDLQNANKVIKHLYSIPWYLKYFKKNQEVMIGYSDSSKDAGKLAASWAQYRAQEELQNVSNEYKVNLTLFHGRGGSVGRGGGPIYEALLSQPPGTVNGHTRVTEQGEVIQQKYATESLAEYNLGTYIGSVLEATLSPPIKPKRQWRRLMEEMSKISSKDYRSNLNDKKFLKYYFKITPQKILEQLSIGSRPAKRNKSKDIESLRAIPWVFAWTQIRFLLTAWLGTFKALSFGMKNQNLLKEMVVKWPFFNAQMDMLDMVLVKTDQRVSKFYEECLGDKSLKFTGERLRKELSSLIQVNKKIIPNYIVEKRKEYRKSIRIRNTYAEVLNILQADIMKKLDKSKLKDKKYLKDAMLITIAGIAAAMKNVG